MCLLDWSMSALQGHKQKHSLHFRILGVGLEPHSTVPHIARGTRCSECPGQQASAKGSPANVRWKTDPYANGKLQCTLKSRQNPAVESYLFSCLIVVRLAIPML